LVEAGDVDRLMRLDVGERPDAVAQARRRLELERVALGLHLPGQALLHVTAAAGKELARLVDQPAVILGADAADAGAGAALYLVLETGARARREHVVGAGAQQEGALQRGDRVVDGAGRRERAVVVALAVVGAAMLQDLRRLVVAGDED